MYSKSYRDALSPAGAFGMSRFGAKGGGPDGDVHRATRRPFREREIVSNGRALLCMVREVQEQLRFFRGRLKR